MVDLNGHEAGNGGHSQGKPTAYRDSSTRRDGLFTTTIEPRVQEALYTVKWVGIAALISPIVSLDKQPLHRFGSTAEN